LPPPGRRQRPLRQQQRRAGNPPRPEHARRRRGVARTSPVTASARGRTTSPARRLPGVRRPAYLTAPAPWIRFIPPQGGPMRYEGRSIAVWAALAGLALTRSSAHAADVEPLLERIKAVGGEGKGNEQAGKAWRELAGHGPDALPAILAGFDGAG